MENTNKPMVSSGNTLKERNTKTMKYQIKYSLPYDIYRYAMDAKDEEQLATFVKMLVEEKAYGIEVVPESNERGAKWKTTKCW